MKIKGIDTLGRRIKTAREERGFSQQQLADEIGTARTRISGWERDEAEPMTQRVIDIAAATGVTINFLLGDFPRLPTTWTPMTVIKISDDTPHDAETAYKLMFEEGGWDYVEDFDLDEADEALRTGAVEFFDGAFVIWDEMGDSYPKEELKFLMWVK